MRDKTCLTGVVGLKVLLEVLKNFQFLNNFCEILWEWGIKNRLYPGMHLPEPMD